MSYLLGIEGKEGSVVIIGPKESYRLTRGDTFTLNLDVGQTFPLVLDIRARKEGEPDKPLAVDRLIDLLRVRGVEEPTRDDAIAILRIVNGVG